MDPEEELERTKDGAVARHQKLPGRGNGGDVDGDGLVIMSLKE
jgi:hypothetical protein